MSHETDNSIHITGRAIALVCITLLIVFTISAPEDFKASLHGTASILPPKTLKLSKLFSQALAFGLLGYYLILLLTTQRLYRALRMVLPLLAFCGWIVASTLWSPLKSTTLIQSGGFVLLIGLSLAIGISSRGEEDFKRVLRLVSFILALLAVGLIFLHFSAPQYGVLTKRSSGLFHSTVAGSSSSLAILILLLSRLLWGWDWSRKLFLPGVLVHAAVMITCGNRLSLALTIVLGGLSVIWFASSHKVAAIAMPCAILATVFLAADPRLEILRSGFDDVGTYFSQGQTGQQLKEVSGRAEMWSVIWDSYWDSPLVGHGYFVTSSKGELYVWYGWGNWTAHNFFLQLLATSGIIGAVLLISGYLLLVYKVAIRYHRNDKMVKCLLILCTWFFGWGMLNASYLGPVQPESVVFSIVIGFAITLAMQNRESHRLESNVVMP